MGNIPLCVPKQETIVFRDCPSSSTNFVLHHNFQIDDSDEHRSDKTLPRTSQTDQPSNRASIQSEVDAAVLGIELDQNSVCKVQ